MSYKAAQLLNKAYICVEQENFAKAVELLEAAVECVPDNDEMHAYLGEAYILNRQYQKAIEIFDKRDLLVLQANPLTSYINGYRGRVYLESGEHEKAKKFLEEAIAQDVKDPEIWYSFGLLHLSQGEDEKARQTMAKIDCLDPAFYFRRIRSLMKSLTDKVVEEPIIEKDNDLQSSGENDQEE